MNKKGKGMTIYQLEGMAMVICLVVLFAGYYILYRLDKDKENIYSFTDENYDEIRFDKDLDAIEVKSDTVDVD